MHNEMRLHPEEGKKCKACMSHSDSWNWFCDACASDNELEPVNECKDCLKKNTSYFFGKTCLSEYMEWLMTGFPGATVVFHNGGKYDLQILVLELMTTGKYMLSHDAMRGSQILYFTATPIDQESKKKSKAVRFIDSCNFIQTSLRSFPAMFDLKDIEKGRFPYDLLNEDKWEEYDGPCPSYRLFGVTEKEYKNMDKLNKARKSEVKEILDYILKWNLDYEEYKTSWNALERLKYYTIKDTEVLHDGCESFRKNFWMLVETDPFQWVTLASAVAGSYRQPRFMKENSIQIFDNVTREWQRQALRGGRCEPFKLYWKATKPTESFKWYDVNSEYPFVQSTGYYPDGSITLDRTFKKPTDFKAAAADFFTHTGDSLYALLHDPSGKTGCGLIECNVSYGYAFLPLLPSKIKTSTYTKNVFQNRCGPWSGYITLLAEAICNNQIIINNITRIQYWRKTTCSLFSRFINTLYVAKLEASGWEKVLNKPLAQITDLDKSDFLKECKKRGMFIDGAQVRDNPGQRATAKIMNNCGWGYLCQKPHANENHWFDNFDNAAVERMGNLLENLETEKDTRRLVSCPIGVGKYTRIRTTKKSEDITTKEMNKKIAYHVGGQVPAYGLQLLSRGLLAFNPEQIGYTDTDSIGFVLDTELLAEGKHKDLKTGPFMGDWVDEYPDARITEFCSLGCKSYFLKIESLDGKHISYKGKFKGLPMGSASFSLMDKEGELAKLGMEEMKHLLFNAIINKSTEEMDMESKDPIDNLTFEFKYTNFFKRSADFKIRPVKEKKTVRFTYDKRDVEIPHMFFRESVNEELVLLKEINTRPFDDYTSTLTADQVKVWWDTHNV